MAIRNMFNRTRLTVKRCNRITAVAVCLAVVLSVISLVVLHAATVDAKQQNQDLKAQAAQLEHENGTLKNKLDILGTLESAKQIAKEFLGLADPDTIVIEPEN